MQGHISRDCPKPQLKTCYQCGSEEYVPKPTIFMHILTHVRAIATFLRTALAVLRLNLLPLKQL